MRKAIIIITALSLLFALALALTACPRTTELEPGQGEVVTTGTMPEMGERETEIPAEGPATTQEELEALEPAEDGAEAEGEEAEEPEGEEAEEAEDTEEEAETE